MGNIASNNTLVEEKTTKAALKMQGLIYSYGFRFRISALITCLICSFIPLGLGAVMVNKSYFSGQLCCFLKILYMGIFCCNFCLIQIHFCLKMRVSKPVLVAFQAYEPQITCFLRPKRSCSVKRKEVSQDASEVKVLDNQTYFLGKEIKR